MNTRPETAAAGAHTDPNCGGVGCGKTEDQFVPKLLISLWTIGSSFVDKLQALL
jgi:hypothetical protein